MMKKGYLKILSLILAIGIFGVANSAFAQAGSTATGVAGVVGGLLGGTFDIVGAILSPIGWLIMQLTSYITMLAGMALNASIYYSVVKMSENIGQVDGINTAWGTIRDVANMGFIFILLWAAIQKIIGIGKDTNRLIVNMIVAAILINFSLFFTKFIIDIANILALAFYKVMVPGNITSANYADIGLSNAMMDALRVSSIWQATGTTFSGGNAIIIMLLSSVVLLITAFIFFAAAIMFVIRYVVLIFVLILSPIAFISQVFPGLQGQAKKWWDALLGQAFFAPIYFLLMWVTIVVANGITTKVFLTGSAASATFGSVFSAPGSNISILINFAVIIGFLIVSLIVAKSQADKAGPVAKSMTKWAMGAAGGMSLGMAGRLGRRTIGATGSLVAESEAFKKAEMKGGMVGAMARLSRAAGTKAAKSSFDVRSAGMFGTLSKQTGVDFGKGIGKDGFEKFAKDEAERKKKYGESLGPSAIVTDEAKQALEAEKAKNLADPQYREEWRKEQANRQKAVRNAQDKLAAAETRHADADEITELRKAVKDAETKQKEITREGVPDIQKFKDWRIKQAQTKVDELAGVNEDEAKKRLKKEGWTDEKLKSEQGKKAIEDRKIKSAGEVRKEAYAQELRNPNLRDFNLVKNSALNKVLFVSKADKQAAADLRKGKKKAEDMLKDVLKETGELKDKEEGGEKKEEGDKGDKKGGEGEGEGGGEKKEEKE